MLINNRNAKRMDLRKEKIEHCSKMFGLNPVEVARYGEDDLYEIAMKIESYDYELFPDF